MPKKMFFIILFFYLFITISRFIDASSFSFVNKKDRFFLEQSLSSMRKKYFENQNFLENDIQVIGVGQKVKIVGLDKVTDHIDASIQAPTDFQASTLEVLDEYCKGQSFAVTSHINEVIAGLKKKIPKEFDKKNHEDLRLVKTRLQSLGLEENREFSKKNQKQKDLVISTMFHSVVFFLCAIKAHEKEQNILTKIIGLSYLKFLWDKGTSFYQEDIKFQEKLAEISLQSIACEARKEDLESNKKLNSVIQEELEFFRQKKVDSLDKTLAEYRSQQLKIIPLILFSNLNESEKDLRKKIMIYRKTEIQKLYIQHQELRSKILLEKEEESVSTTESSESDEGVAKSFLSKAFNFFGF